MSTTTTPPRLQPPINDPPITEGGQHSQAWSGYFVGLADQLDTLPARMRKGVTDGSDAAAGDIGEYLSVVSGAVPLTNAALANVVSVSLTAGDWDVAGNVQFAAGAGTHSFFGAGMIGLDTFISATFPSAALNQAITTATTRLNVTTTTTFWLVAEAAFTGTCTATGSIRARRMR